ncbi:hypothetical protein KC909_02255 [Candidatus Dojkabacteria bacterium]|uniref:Uncharacterized protein n=1 Tax=Candidatus Dojkabacteria bacterium TaxID=2099670 RepID=A0A955L518_9BACT|nr:hypothetical protein [Candidatus Dojkabacteria bacterium]
MWEVPGSYQEFALSIESIKEQHRASLTRLYSAARANYIDGRGGTLVLGPGGGQVLQMMGMPGELVTAIDVSPENLDKAAERLPGATLIEALFEEGLPVAGYHPTIFASDSLDCVPPHKLPLVCHQMAQLTDRVVAVQNFIPDNSYYSPSISRDNTEPFIQNLGIELHWPEDKLFLLDDLVAELGFGDPLADVEHTIAVAQDVTERDLGFKLPWRVNQTDTYLQLGRVPAPMLYGMFGDYSLFAQVIALVENRTRDFEDIFEGRFPERSFENMQSMHNTGMLNMFYGTLVYKAYNKLLEYELRQAGFESITRLKVFATDKRLVGSDQAGALMSKAMNPNYRPHPRAKMATMMTMLNGARMITHNHSRPAKELASIEVLIAE